MNDTKTELARLCEDIKILTSTSESQSKIGLAGAIYALVKLFENNNNSFGYTGFIELMRRSGLPEFTMKYQSYRYNYNLGFLYQFSDQKLNSNCLRRGSEAMIKLQKLDLQAQTKVKDLISKQTFVTIADLEGYIRIASGECSLSKNEKKNKVEKLQQVITGLFPALENMVVYSDDMPRHFYVNFTTSMAETLWEQSIKEQSVDIQQLLLVNLQTLYFSLIDISAVLLDNRELIYIKKLAISSPLYKNIPLDTNIPDVLIALKREFLGMFKQEQLKALTDTLMKDVTDRKALFEYMTARNVMRTKDELALAFREFY